MAVRRKLRERERDIFSHFKNYCCHQEAQGRTKEMYLPAGRVDLTKR
jgi:hypothetical protein